MLGNILQSNRNHVDLAIKLVLSTEKRKVGLIGLSFKPGTDDLRESPLVSLAEHLIGKGLKLTIYDPEVHLSRLLGANRRFIETHLPHLGALLRSDIGEVIGDSEVLVVGMQDQSIHQALAAKASAGQIVIDLVNLPSRTDILAKVVGLCW